MDDDKKIVFKNKLKHACRQLIEERIDVDKRAIESAREICNQEEKSTVGDKYETARSMGQLEQDMYARQLAENLKELAILQAIDVNNLCNEVSSGSFIQCNNISFFIAAGLGKRTIDGKTILFLSPNAPLAKLLLHKRAGDTFIFNKVNMIISEVF
ncbi:MAG TPA: hypothetical protein VMT76_01845 [Puia sp.]|nr:hypothetical protein [Puia sp.]